MSRRDWTDKELFQRLLTNKTTKTYWDNVRELHLRVNKYVFNKSVKLAGSNIPKERIIGIDVLAQLGIAYRPYYNETIKLYFEILEKEQDQKVLTSLFYAIGHNNDNLDQESIDKLLAFKTTNNNSLRFALVCSLLGLENEQAINTLIELSKDKVSSIRNWATFGIGSQIDADNEKIRKALWDRIDDKHEETKCEAIVGLAERKDKKINDIIKRELLKGDYGSLLFEAIELIDGVEFIPLLKKESILAKKDPHINLEWKQDIEELIEYLKKKKKFVKNKVKVSDV